MLHLAECWFAGYAGDLPVGPEASCLCSDVAPRNQNNTVTLNCQQQLEGGSCNADFMKQTVKEVPEGGRLCTLPVAYF